VHHLYALASPNAQWLMQLADTECFAVDDGLVLTQSRDFRGWAQQEIETTLVTTSLPIPQDLDRLRQEKIPAIERHYTNSLHYRLVSFTPPFNKPDRLQVTLAPICFFDYYSLTPFFDEPVLTALDGSPISIREKYGNTALTYVSTDRGTSLIPAPVSVQGVLVTSDDQLVLMRRSSLVAFYPHHWSASFEETMNAPSSEGLCAPEETTDADFFSAAIRGLQEEFAIPARAVRDATVLSLNVEYLTLSVDVIVVIQVDLSADAIRQTWLLSARDKNEATKLSTIPADLPSVVKQIGIPTLWHPTSRMRLIQYLFERYGVDGVANALSTSA
jgi:hypothetical protein